MKVIISIITLIILINKITFGVATFSPESNTYLQLFMGYQNKRWVIGQTIHYAITQKNKVSFKTTTLLSNLKQSSRFKLKNWEFIVKAQSNQIGFERQLTRIPHYSSNYKNKLIYKTESILFEEKKK